jgi:branched-chain amino acid transport system permease protein
MVLINYVRDLPGREKLGWLVAIAFVTLIALLPMVINVDMWYGGVVIFYACVYIVIGQGWNLVGGYTGQISLGQNAFFGIGGYVTAGMWIHGIGLYFLFDFVIMIVAGLVPALLAVLIGVPLLARLRGDYFAFGTLGFAGIIGVLFLKGGGFTGGAMGLGLDSSVFSGMLVYYWVGLALAVGSTLLVYFIGRSRIGLALRAIREDEISAAAHGVNVLKYKVLAFSIGAFLAGLGGSMWAYYLFDVKPDSMYAFTWGLYPILICVLGGSGTVIGPAIGGVIVAVLATYGNRAFPGSQAIIAGLLIIVVMLFMPEGIMGLVSRVSSMLQRGSSPTMVGAGDTAE